jgi:hypothetical protein
MPKYMLLIVEDEAEFAEEGTAEFDAVMAAHEAFGKEVAELGGSIVGGEALQSVSTATFLRNTRTDRVTAVDNPAPDLKEVIGGFYLVEAPDDATARRIAERCPAGTGYIELRPVWDIPGDDAG